MKTKAATSRKTREEVLCISIKERGKKEMKKSKIFTLILCTALLSVATVLGTLAYLTSRDSVTNTFTVGQVKIDVHETLTDKDGNIVDKAGNKYESIDACPVGECITEEGNNYHVLPGMRYFKNPTMTVKANSEESYVRMMMIVHNATAVDAIIAADPNVEDYADLFDGWDEAKWLYEGFEADTAANTITFEFRYAAAVAGSDADQKLEPLFTELVVPGTVTNEQLEALYNGGFKIEVQGHAIQTASFADEDAAWTAFDVQMNPAP